MPIAHIISWLAAALCLASNTVGSALGYPNRPVKMVVPFPPGTAGDQIARIIGPQLQESVGQPFVVENKSGALGTIGAAEVARSAPDGYTVMLTTNTTQAGAVALVKSLPYDPQKDFAPIMRLVTTAMVLLVRSDFPGQTLEEFLAYARAKSGALTGAYSTAGSQVSMAKLKALGGFSVIDVSYKGPTLAVTDVLAGHVSFTFADFAVALSQIGGGKLKGLGVTSLTRTPLAPDIPAISEALPGFETVLWFGLVAPAGTPREVVIKLYSAGLKGLAKPEVKARFDSLGLTIAPLSPEEFSRYIRSEIFKWTKEAKEAGIQPE